MENTTDKHTKAPSDPTETPAASPQVLQAKGTFHAEEECGFRQLAGRVGRRMERVGWVEVAAGAAIGLGIGYLLGSRRSNETLADIFSDSIRPWASRHVHGAVDSVRASRPACGLASAIDRLKNS